MLDYSIYYRKWHDGSKEHFDDYSCFYRRPLSEVLRPTSLDARILDFGCNQGLLVYALGRAGFHNFEGIDLSEHQIAVAKQYDPPCRVVNRDYVFDLAKAAPRTLDSIFMMDALEHVEKDEQLRVLAAASDLLGLGGRLFLSVSNANAALVLRWRYNDWTHEIAFTEHSLEFLLLNSGFAEVGFLPYEFISRPRMAFIPRRSSTHWALHRFFRIFRRLEAVCEMCSQGWSIPLSLNLLTQCVKVDAKL